MKKRRRKLSLAQVVKRREAVYNSALRKIAGAECIERVKDLQHLVELANNKRSVFGFGCLGLLPATVVLNMRARSVHFLIYSGSLIVYPK